MVPTQETIRVEFMIEHYVRNKMPLLVMGPNSTGKTNIVTNMLRDQKILQINFSIQTVSQNLSDYFYDQEMFLV